MKRSLLLLALLLGATAAFALEKDSEGYYLLGSVDDWRAFAELVNSNTNPAANAKMIADIDLGTDQTHIGQLNEGVEPYYSGTFDGQGHTLTVAYEGRGILAPFTQTRNATIKNLHLDGSIRSYSYCTGVVGFATAADTVTNVWNSASLWCHSSDWSWTGGIVGGCRGGSSKTLRITDCLFTGSVDAEYYSGCFLGGDYNGSAIMTNCLSTGTFNTGDFRQTHVNCYVLQFPKAIPAEMQCTAEQLADGTIAAALQAGREETVWFQDPETNQPMLAVFKYELRQDADGYYLLDSRRAWDAFAELVNENPSVNARMTRDIDLGDDQTMIGSTAESASSPAFAGIFDGNGCTLTIAYTGVGAQSVGAPFAKINGATIKNLHVAGTLSSAGFHPTSIVSDSWGNSTLENVWGEVDIVGTRTGWVEASGLVGCMKAGSLTITDCLFTGTVNGAGSYNGCFIGYIDRGSATVTNCLSTGEFVYSGGSNEFRGQHTNCYVKQFPSAIPAGMQCTDEQLADGTIAEALQAGRTRKIWVQDDAYGRPTLRSFIKIDGDLNRDGIVDVEDVNILVNIILGLISAEDYGTRANVDHQGGVDVSDINAVISIITGK